MRVASAIELSGEQRTKLLKLAHSQTASVRLARRCAMVLLAHDGYDNITIAEMLDTGRIQVARWRERFAQAGLGAIEKDLPRGGRPTDSAKEAQIVQLTTQSVPQAATHWSTRSLGKVLGVSDTMVHRVWLTPTTLARLRVLQWVAASGLLWVVSCTICASLALSVGDRKSVV